MMEPITVMRVEQGHKPHIPKYQVHVPRMESPKSQGEDRANPAPERPFLSTIRQGSNATIPESDRGPPSQDPDQVHIPDQSTCDFCGFKTVLVNDVATAFGCVVNPFPRIQVKARVPVTRASIHVIEPGWLGLDFPPKIVT